MRFQFHRNLQSSTVKATNEVQVTATYSWWGPFLSCTGTCPLEGRHTACSPQEHISKASTLSSLSLHLCTTACYMKTPSQCADLYRFSERGLSVVVILRSLCACSVSSNWSCVFPQATISHLTSSWKKTLLVKKVPKQNKGGKCPESPSIYVLPTGFTASAKRT